MDNNTYTITQNQYNLINKLGECLTLIADEEIGQSEIVFLRFAGASLIALSETIAGYEPTGKHPTEIIEDWLNELDAGGRGYTSILAFIYTG